MNKRQVVSTLGLGVLALGFSTNVANAIPIQWSVEQGGNGHWYDVIHYRSTWDDANAHVQTQHFNGMQGYLATLTSAEENLFVWSSFSFDGYWLGGYQTSKDNEPAGNWAWITGEAWRWTNWRPGWEPNNAWGDEDHLQFDWAVGQYWNDMHNSWFSGSDNVYFSANPDGGYIVEYGGVSIPEPATLFLFGIGIAGQVITRMRRKKM
jgi:hypothetical protein